MRHFSSSCPEFRTRSQPHSGPLWFDGDQAFTNRASCESQGHRHGAAGAGSPSPPAATFGTVPISSGLRQNLLEASLDLLLNQHCQGPWSVDLRTPPGPEGSNGSLLRIRRGHPGISFLSTNSCSCHAIRSNSRPQTDRPAAVANRKSLPSCLTRSSPENTGPKGSATW